MNLRPARTEEPDINLTPLIDVVFNILLFFIVTTTFINEGALSLTLPEASPEARAADSPVLLLTIDADGQYTLDSRALINRQRDTVRRALTGLIEQGDQRPLVIKADRLAPHESVVWALDAAGQAGIGKVSIATTPDDKTP